MKKFYRLLLLSILMTLFFANMSYSQWVEVYRSSSNSVSCLVAIGTNLFAGTNFILNIKDGSTSIIILSTNSGKTCTEMSKGFTEQRIGKLFTDGNNLYVGTGKELFLSKDNGKSWAYVDIGMKGSSTEGYKVVNSLFNNGANLFAGTSEGVFISTDSGKSWKSTNNEGLSYIGVTAVAAIGTNIFKGTAEGMFISANNGTSWEPINNGLTDKNVRVLAVMGNKLFAGTKGKVFLTTDYGKNWISVSNGLTDNYPEALIVNGTNLFLGNNAGVFVSTNSGESWTMSNAGLGTLPYVDGLTVCGDNLFISASGRIFRRPLSGIVLSYAETPEICIQKGNEKYGLKDFEGALAYYTKAIELNPKFELGYQSIGFIKLNLGDYKGAIEEYNKAIELNQNNFEALCGRGIASLKSDNVFGSNNALKDFLTSGHLSF